MSSRWGEDVNAARSGMFEWGHYCDVFVAVVVDFGLGLSARSWVNSRAL